MRELHARELRDVLLEVDDLVLPQPSLHDDRRQRIAGVPVQQREDVLGRDAGQAGERAAARCAAPASSSAGRPATARPRARDVLDDDVAVRSSTGPRGASMRSVAHAVVVRDRQVLVAREHLQRPEPQEEDGEHREREKREDRDAERELRRQAVGLLDARVARQEAAAGRAALAKEPHLAHAVAELERREEAPDDAYTGSVSSRLSSSAERQRARDEPRRRRLAEHELQREQAERVEAGDRPRPRGTARESGRARSSRRSGRSRSRRPSSAAR